MEEEEFLVESCNGGGEAFQAAGKICGDGFPGFYLNCSGGSAAIEDEIYFIASLVAIETEIVRQASMVKAFQCFGDDEVFKDGTEEGVVLQLVCGDYAHQVAGKSDVVKI